MTFGTAFNWCDRNCSRCPLRGECPIPKREAQQRWLHEMHGRDPDAPENVLSDIEVELERAHAMLVDLEAEEAEDEPLEELPSTVPISLGKRQLDDAVLEWVRLMRRAEPIAEARGAAGQHDATQEKYWIIAMKIARITTYEHMDAELIAMDQAPNLLLLERAVAEWNHEAMKLEDMLRGDADGLEAARRTVLRLVAPYLAEIAPEHRAELQQLVQLRRAPSPFAVA